MTALANVVLTAALAPVFGVWGVLTGTAVAFTVGAFLQVILVHRRLDMPLSNYWRAVLPTVGRAAALSVPVFMCSILLDDMSRTVRILAVCGCAVAMRCCTERYRIAADRCQEAISRKLALLPMLSS